MRIPRISGGRAVLAVAAFFCAVNAAPLLAKDPPPDLCSLLTPAQIEKTLGQPFGVAQKSGAPSAFAGQPSGTQCEFAAQKGPAIKVVFIAYVDASATQAKETFGRLAAFYTPKSKPSIGDSAYIDKAGSIHVLKGRVRFYVGIEPAGTSKSAPYFSWLSKGQSSPATPAEEKQLQELAAGVAAEL